MFPTAHVEITWLLSNFGLNFSKMKYASAPLTFFDVCLSVRLSTCEIALASMNVYGTYRIMALKLTSLWFNKITYLIFCNFVQLYIVTNYMHTQRLSLSHPLCLDVIILHV